MQKSNSDSLFFRSFQEGILLRVHRQSQDKIKFDAHQKNQAIFKKNTQQVQITLSQITQTILIEDGFSSQISKRLFSINEIYQVMAFPLQWTTQSKDGTKSTLYTVTFVFRNSAQTQISVLFEMQEFQRFKIALEKAIDIESRKHLLVIKQHLVPSRPKVQQSLQVDKNLNTGKPEDVPFPDLICEAPVIVQHGIGAQNRKTIVYQVCIRNANDPNKKFQKSIQVSINPQNEAIEIQVVNNSTVYEVISVYRIESTLDNKVEVTLRGKKIWEIEFENIYKMFQFLQQVRVYEDQRLKLRTNQVSQIPYIQINVLTQTWNMARTHQNIDFEKLVPNPTKYSIIVWGAQECKRQEKEEQIGKLTSYLGSDFIQIGCVNMWEMFLVAFIHKTDFIGLKVKSVQTNYLTLGVMNIIGNKGGLMLQFTLYGKTFSFVNVHLTSGATKAGMRADMMGAALKGISLSKTVDKFEPDALADFNFIIGDLNSRFKSTYSQHIDNVTHSQNLIEELDEMHEMRILKGRYPGYYEQPITFLPTYKCDQFENMKYINKKDQCPSYTDRILVKVNDTSSEVQYNEYDSRIQVLGSDHRPVYQDIQINLRLDNYMNPLQLMDLACIEQSAGQLKFSYFKIQLDKTKFAAIKRKLVFPVFIQLQFRSNWICSKPFSDEKRAKQVDSYKNWKAHQLPILHTPINSQSIIASKRLLAIIALNEGTSQIQENFAYCLLKFNKMKQLNEVTYQKTVRGDIIGYNSILGDFECTVDYVIKGEAYRKQQVGQIGEQFSNDFLKQQNQFAEESKE